jgi:hypothetical protein
MLLAGALTIATERSEMRDRSARVLLEVKAGCPARAATVFETE